ncbi:maleylpyruvate isomerase family mycothiol-dependent enzyme [Actinomadura macrotermitis]|uniref:Mycothiol-dependent maleylpyruvate isomerase metal-binding domain-containing protein n=1 Tax=Actinomadura macrotermitis TaxID=2585200 RepID=A0A7K0C7J9_9ACTN|nr:maleylpyruvate isomerase family mycothiol-dependent enzyme [Actinomadura macrotermitis]MQY09316.1 hypothetical protein [Actinomadura macrotermitis]
MSPLDNARLAAGLRDHAAAFAALVSGADPDAPVPTCPGWTVRTLVEHVGHAHRWVAGLLEGRAEEEHPAVGADGLEAGAEQVIEAVQADPGRLVWTFFGDRPAAFWLRRMLHETTVHHADAALALGGPWELAPDLADDGIGELMDLLDVLKTTERGADLRGDGETLLFRPAESDLDGWLITRRPDGPVWERTRGGGQVEVRGPAAHLLLVLTRRIGADDPRIEVAGDRPLLDHWLARTAFG